MKLNWPTVTVLSIGAVCMVAMVYFLSAAGWSEGGIAGLVTGIGAVITSIIVQLRGQQNQAHQLDALDRKTDVVVAQTNGLSDRERQDIAQRAALIVLEQGQTDPRVGEER